MNTIYNPYRRWYLWANIVPQSFTGSGKDLVNVRDVVHETQSYRLMDFIYADNVSEKLRLP